jgi:hypothetical protein
VGRERLGREGSPLAAMMRRSKSAVGAGAGADTAGEVGRAGEVDEKNTQAPPAPVRGSGRAPAGRGGTGKKLGRPRGGRRSNPNYVGISALVHRDVKFALDRRLAEESERAGRQIHMTAVIEDLMRYYVDHGNPYGGAGA